MNIQERLMQFQDELAERKQRMDSRIKMLQIASPDTGNNRIELIQAGKKELSDIQDIFYDYFYNELTSVGSEVQFEVRPASMSLDQLFGADEQPEKRDTKQDDKSLDPPKMELNQQSEKSEGKAEHGTTKKTKPDMGKLLGNINATRQKHNKD